MIGLNWMATLKLKNSKLFQKYFSNSSSYLILVPLKESTEIKTGM